MRSARRCPSRISINRDYAAKPHRDSRNEGPSVVAALGNFTGGELQCWHSDPGHGPIARAARGPSRIYQPKNKAVLFNGNALHAVQPFQGNRFSIVLFTCQRYATIPQELRDQAYHSAGPPMKLPTSSNTCIPHVSPTTSLPAAAPFTCSISTTYVLQRPLLTRLLSELISVHVKTAEGTRCHYMP